MIKKMTLYTLKTTSVTATFRKEITTDGSMYIY